MPLTTQIAEVTNYSFEGRSLAPIGTGSITMTDEYFSDGVSNNEGFLITSLPTPTGVTISFSTPFIYLPSGTESVSGGLNENDNIAYGYVPHDLINWMVQNADYARQYAGLTSCLPGGPSILPSLGSSSASPSVLPHTAPQPSAQDLTFSTIVSVNSLGCFRPGYCPTSPQVQLSPSITPATPTVPNGIPDRTLPTSSTASATTRSTFTNPPPITSTTSQSSQTPILRPPTWSTTSPQPSSTTGHSRHSPIRRTTTWSTTSTQTSSTTGGLAGIIISIFGYAGSSALPEISVGYSTLTGDSASAFIIGSQTLTPGGPAITVSGTAISLAPFPTSLHVPPAVITLNSQLITENSASEFVVGSQTFTAGASAVTVSGTVYPVSHGTPTATKSIKLSSGAIKGRLGGAGRREMGIWCAVLGLWLLMEWV